MVAVFLNYPEILQEPLHAAILTALNNYSALKNEVDGTAVELISTAKSKREGDGMSLLSLRDRLAALTAEQQLLLDKVLEDMDNPELTVQLKTLAEEKQELQNRISALRQDEVHRANQESCMAELQDFLKADETRFEQYDDALTRRFVKKSWSWTPRPSVSVSKTAMWGWSKSCAKIGKRRSSKWLFSSQAIPTGTLPGSKATSSTSRRS